MDIASALRVAAPTVFDDGSVLLAYLHGSHAAGTCAFSRDEVARVRWASLPSRMFHDFKIHEERSARERLEQSAAGGA
jgi:hypothetical protein